MKFVINHNNLNVLDLNKSIAFYQQALGLKEVRRKEASDGSFILVLTILPQPMLCIVKWDVFVMKTKVWVFTSLPILMDIGSRLFPSDKSSEGCL